MSMNQYMHPRNIYKKPPDFKQLAIEYPEFRKYAIQDISGKVSIDFKNVDALRALSCTLLKKDFGLQIEIPENKLIPTIPLRLNYILWIEDLLHIVGTMDTVKGIDIGTGASCIYPILAARQNKWAMIGTEIDSESVRVATKNVQENGLDNLIKILKIEDSKFFQPVMDRYPDDYEFSMCNPPFFSNTQELHPFFKARKQSRAFPKNAFCACVDEVVVNGGEIDYITKLINESKLFADRIKLFTTMVGHKSSLPALKKKLREAGVVSFKQSEFCQGHTTRWGLAWTFNDYDLTKIPDSLIAAKQKLAKPLYYQIPKIDNKTCKLNYVAECMRKIFQTLEIEFQEIKRASTMIEYVITAYSNTWSHQRRKRREQIRFNNSSEEKNEISFDSNELHQTCDKLAELNCNGNKRGHEEDGFYYVKKIKTESSTDTIYLKAKIGIVKVDLGIALELVFFEGIGNKEALHQILQYIKNNLHKDS